MNNPVRNVSAPLLLSSTAASEFSGDVLTSAFPNISSVKNLIVKAGSKMLKGYKILASPTKLLVLIILFFPFLITNAQEVRISVFNSIPIKGLILAVYNGSYDIRSENQMVAVMTVGEIFYITLYNQQLLLNNSKGSIGSFNELHIVKKNENGKLKITPIDPKTGSRSFSDNLLLRIDYGRIMMINETEPERYIAGVVEAETGITSESEFQKAQALLCRTYLYNHLNRHETEGFNLCDDEHCQVYRGQSPFTKSIFESTVLTRNMVIIDSDSSLITATYHGNCGGETESSLNTWINGKDYLVPVKDPLCQHKSNANWTKEISVSEWKKYLTNYGFNVNNLEASSLEMKKKGRQIHYQLGKNSILMRQIRADWKLKSSYFQVLAKNNKILLKGHGYGHGVGMCQDGAMKMAANGLRYEDIINFYFRNVKIVEYYPSHK